MAILINGFTPSVTILPTDFISNTDDKLRTITSEQRDWLNKEVQNAVTQMSISVDTKIAELASVGDETYTSLEIDKKVKGLKLLRAEKMNLKIL